jgi:hypothetical protein
MTSNYYIKGRLFPTVLTVVPLLIFVNFIISNLYNDFLKDVFIILPLLANLGISAALIFLMVQLNRFVAKEVFQRIFFKDETNMPTTNHLLWSDNFFDKSIKEKIRNKIQSQYGLNLTSEIEESENESISRKQIVTAVSQIRNSLRDNKLLLQHNIEYGFFRNLLGGALIAILFSIFIFAYGALNHEINLKFIGVIFTVIYFVPLLFSKLLIKRFGNYYSKILYEQFLSI